MDVRRVVIEKIIPFRVAVDFFAVALTGNIVPVIEDIRAPLATGASIIRARVPVAPAAHLGAIDLTSFCHVDRVPRCERVANVFETTSRAIFFPEPGIAPGARVSYR
jgi:hypothetical protein